MDNQKEIIKYFILLKLILQALKEKSNAERP